MKIIDQTPFYDENGEISLVDRGKAILKYGAGWFKEIDAQKSIISVLEKSLDKKYSLLRNVTPSGLGTAIPFILVGPTGVYVMSVTALAGTWSARGDQWGSFSGTVFRTENPNLLTRTEKMARVVQVFLQRQGYTDLLSVEPVLLCSDPATHIDTIRPIIRVIMRDTLERFTVSIAQGRVLLSAEAVYDIVNRILNPPEPAPEEQTESTGEAEKGEAAMTEDPTYSTNQSNLNNPSENSVPEIESTSTLDDKPLLQESDSENNLMNEQEMPTEEPARRGLRITRKQWGFLIAMLIIWILMLGVLAFLIFRDLNPQLLLAR